MSRVIPAQLRVLINYVEDYAYELDIERVQNHTHRKAGLLCVVAIIHHEKKYVPMLAYSHVRQPSKR